jgi:hypothetical protein
MLEEDPEPTRTIRSHATPGNDTGKGDGLAVLLLQGLQAGSVSPGVLAGQVAHLQALNPYRHRVGVIGVVRLGRQDRVHLFPHTAIWGVTPSDDAPEVVLVAGLADDFEVFSALAQLNLHAIAHPGGRLFRAPGGVSVGLLLAASEQPS